MAWQGLRKAWERDPRGVREIQGVASDLGLRWADLAWTVEVESSWRPDAANPEVNAAGLIQFLPSTLKKLGYQGSYQDFRRLSIREQAPWVRRYFEPYADAIRSSSRAGSLYLVCAGPSYLQAADDRVVGKVGSKVWQQNPGWRGPNQGDVTVGSIRAYGTPRGEPPIGGGSSPALWGGLFVLVVAWVLLARR